MQSTSAYEDQTNHSFFNTYIHGAKNKTSNKFIESPTH